MKRFLVIAGLLTCANAFAQPAMRPREETVTVSGTGRANLAPDRFTFTAGVRTTAPTVEDAVNQNNTRVANVIAALKKAGATEQEIRTSNFSIYPQQVYEQGQPPRVTGYQVMNSITVTKKDPAAAGKLLQTAISGGVNEASALSFEVSDPSRGRDEGLRAAFADAHAKAALLASAAGRTLGRALTIVEGNAPAPPRPMQAVRTMAGIAAAATEVPVETGQNELSYTVSVIFELQ